MFESIYVDDSINDTPIVKDPFGKKWWDDGSGAISTPWDDLEIWQEEA